MRCLNRICPTFTSPLHMWLTWRQSCSRLFVGGVTFASPKTYFQISAITNHYALNLSAYAHEKKEKGLSYDTNESVLKDTFEEYGEVIEVKVICDRVSGKSRGYGFVHFSSEAEASKALKEMDGRLLEGRNIRIHYARKGGSQASQDE